MSTKAQKMFDAEAAFKTLEGEMEDALMEACGIPPNEPDKWPHTDITHDYYDNSFEFQGVKGDWCPTPEQLAACWALGFSRCWINYQVPEGAPRKEKAFGAPLLKRSFPGEYSSTETDV
jgi:hypothetical protein